MVNPISETTESTIKDTVADLVSSEDNNSKSLETEELTTDSTLSNNLDDSITQVTSEIPTQNIDASPPPTPIEPSISKAEVVKPMAENVTDTMKSASPVAETFGNYEDYQLLPEAPWPPPIFVKQNISPQERYYIEHRWYSQWSFFDNKATQNKNRYYRTQLIVGLGSVTVPVLVGIRAENEAGIILYFVTVVISLAVAMSTAIESLYTFGDNWRSYRSAAEDLHQEKSLYDVKAGRYANNPTGFLRFVERCEEIIAQQNGRWIQSQEKSAEQTKELGEDFLETYGSQESGEDGKKGISVEQVRKTTVEESFTATPVEDEDDEEPLTETYVDPAAPTSYG